MPAGPRKRTLPPRSITSPTASATPLRPTTESPTALWDLESVLPSFLAQIKDARRSRTAYEPTSGTRRRRDRGDLSDVRDGGGDEQSRGSQANGPVAVVILAVRFHGSVRAAVRVYRGSSGVIEPASQSPEASAPATRARDFAGAVRRCANRVSHRRRSDPLPQPDECR